MKRKQGSWVPWALVAPGVLWVLVFALWPFLNTVRLSFTNARPLTTPEFTGLENYVRLFHDERFGYAMTTSLVYAAVCIPLLTFLPLLLALLVNAKIPGIAFFRTTFYFPVIASAVVVAIVWQFLFSSTGTVNQALKMLGWTDRPIDFLSDRWLLIFCAIGLTVWKGLGYYMVVYLAALGSVGRDLHEAAAIDGAGTWRRFWSVTVPGVRGAMVLVAVLIAASAMRVFTELYVLSNGTGGPGGHSMSMVMLIQTMGKGLTGQTGYASAISMVLFLMTLIPLTILAIANYGQQIKDVRRQFVGWRDHRKMNKELRREEVALIAPDQEISI